MSAAMLPVVIVDFGLLIAFVGLVTIVRPARRLGVPTRGRALGVFAAGCALALAGALLPAPAKRARAAVSALDRMVPVWQFDERHETRIHATPAEVERAVREVTAREIRLFRALTWLRSPRLPGRESPESILAPPADEPLLAVALRSGFQPLAEEHGRELVFGTLVVVPDEIRRLPRAERAARRQAFTAERFAALADPGFAKAVMSFRWQDEGGGVTRLVTETRIVATDASARRRFGAYWRLIYPGSSLIRYSWLAAIRARAERHG